MLRPLAFLLALGLASTAPLAQSQVREVQAPISSSLYVRGTDRLRIATRGFTGGLTVTVAGRFLSPLDGSVQTFTFTHTPASDGSEGTSDSASATSGTAANPQIVGPLLSVNAWVSAGTIAWGNLYGALRIVDTTGNPSMELTAGTFSAANRLAWPGRTNKVIRDAPGAMVLVSGTNPAAGAEISDTVPAGVAWRLVSWRADLITDGTVANRVVQLVIDDGTTEFYRQPSSLAQAASNTFRYLAGGIGDRSNGSGVNGPQFSVPAELRLMAGYRLKTVTVNLQAADDWGQPQFLVERWIEAAPLLAAALFGRPGAH